jgi:hypothetical protein
VSKLKTGVLSVSTPIIFWSMTDRTPVFHLDTLKLNFSDYFKKVFYWPPNPKLYGEPYIDSAVCPTGLVHGLQIDLDESIGHVEPINLVNINALLTGPQ